MKWLEAHASIANWLSAIVAIIVALVGAFRVLYPKMTKKASLTFVTQKRLIVAILWVGMIFEVFAASSPFVAIGVRIISGIGAVVTLGLLVLHSLPDR
jgi:hypothetical protein